MADATDDPREAFLDAALSHVPFDGWSEATFRAAADDTGTDMAAARTLFPRGPVDLACAYHERGDAQMLARIAETDMAEMRFRDRITAAVQFRLEAGDRELVRRGTTLFSLPQNAATGAHLVWTTCGRIWEALGDTSQDYNWYTKRATLAGVYSATLLYWLGDDSEDHARTWDFLDRRIEDVMRFEKFKADIRANAALKPLLAGPEWLLSHIRAPSENWRDGLPGRWRSGGQ